MGNAACAAPVSEIILVADALSERADCACTYADEEEMIEKPSQVMRCSWSSIPALKRNANLRELGLRTSDVSIDEDHFDPTTLPLKDKILSNLGMSRKVRIKSLKTDQNGTQVSHGFNNAGMWTIMDETGITNLVMKLVRPELEEGSRFQKLATEFPDIVWDPLLAFPLQVIRCSSPQSSKPREFIIMPKAAGAVLHDFVLDELRRNVTGALQQLLPIFGALGAALARFHLEYRHKQHGDFQPTNIMYNKDSNEITFIDMANMGSPLSPPGSDIKQFQSSLRALYGHLRNNVAASFTQQFMNGYQQQTQTRFERL